MLEPAATANPAYTYCDLRCEICPLAGDCDVAAVTGGDGPLPPTPIAYAELRDRRAVEIERRLERRMAEAYLAHGERPDLARYQAALDRALFDPLAERARELERAAVDWLRRWHTRWSCQLRAPLREAGLVDALDDVGLDAALVSDKVVRGLWLSGVGGHPAEVEQPLAQVRTALVALERLQTAWSTLAHALPLTEAELERDRCARLAADLAARFPRATTFRRPGLDDGSR
ncbi:MAG: hypothetical protein R3F62_19000 [Planctomycetota bacterium]